MNDFYLAAGAMLVATGLFVASFKWKDLWKVGLAIVALTFALSFYDLGHTVNEIGKAMNNISKDLSSPITIPTDTSSYDSGDPCDITSKSYDPSDAAC